MVVCGKLASREETKEAFYGRYWCEGYVERREKTEFFVPAAR